jgi:hypothetical protein
MPPSLWKKGRVLRPASGLAGRAGAAGALQEAARGVLWLRRGVALFFEFVQSSDGALLVCAAANLHYCEDNLTDGCRDDSALGAVGVILQWQQVCEQW